MQLRKTGAMEPDEVVVVVLTSGGLKDHAASRAWLPAVPSAGDSFDDVLAVLRKSYGLELDR